MDRLGRLKANLQNQKHKVEGKIFEKILEAKDHQHKETGVVHQVTETAIFIATPMKKLI